MFGVKLKPKQEAAVVRVESDAEVCGVTNAHRNCGNQKMER